MSWKKITIGPGTHIYELLYQCSSESLSGLSSVPLHTAYPLQCVTALTDIYIGEAELLFVYGNEKLTIRQFCLPVL
jgi:hypothetical protein